LFLNTLESNSLLLRHPLSGSFQNDRGGFLELNQQDSITIDDLKESLRTAISHGLQLVIFNSCDGLGLAKQLEDLHLPQMIVMRERVPDEVAQGGRHGQS